MENKPSQKPKKPEPVSSEYNSKLSTQKKKSNQRSIDFFSNFNLPSRPSQLHTESITSFADLKSKKHSKDSDTRIRSAHKNFEPMSVNKKRDNLSISKQVHSNQKDHSTVRSSNNFRNSKGLTMKSKEKYPIGKENIFKNNLTSPANVKLKAKLVDISNLIESPCVQKNLTNQFKANLHSKKPSDLANKAVQNFNQKQNSKKASSFIASFYPDSLKHNLEADNVSHPRTANPSFVENEFTQIDSNFTCARVLRTTNDTDKEIESQDVPKKPKIFGIKSSKPADRLYLKTGFRESPVCHLKMPKSDTFYESRKKKPIFQRYGTET